MHVTGDTYAAHIGKFTMALAELVHDSFESYDPVSRVLLRPTAVGVGDLVVPLGRADRRAVIGNQERTQTRGAQIQSQIAHAGRSRLWFREPY